MSTQPQDQAPLRSFQIGMVCILIAFNIYGQSLYGSAVMLIPFGLLGLLIGLRIFPELGYRPCVALVVGALLSLVLRWPPLTVLFAIPFFIVGMILGFRSKR